ncbi:MAG TPA: YkgJ family cysteine cluster protein [Sedimentisphaerales bacterium]|nr:YkgJ family cysteine cluster protein [Sedimentisphaerales bacterium]
MVGKPEGHGRLIQEVASLYDWIAEQLRKESARVGSCNACGACCDFPSYGHRLFVTPPELIYLAAKLDVERLLPMPGGRCPYQQNNRCGIYQHRFVGCRIFHCRGDSVFQNELSQAALKCLKNLCEQFQIPYRYTDLSAAVNMFNFKPE